MSHHRLHRRQPVRMGGGGFSARRHPCPDQTHPRPVAQFIAGAPLVGAQICTAARRATAAPIALAAAGRLFTPGRIAFRPRSANASQTLDVLRDFSSILTHSLNAEAMLKQFLLFLREIFSVNRAAIFLNRPVAAAQRNGVPGPEAAACAPPPPSASPPGLLEHFELSLDAGIGGQLVAAGPNPAPRQRRGPRRRRGAEGI